MKTAEVGAIQKRALEFLKKADIVVTPEEETTLEVADFGLQDVENVGLELVVYENNPRYCAKELILFPRQMCPEHRHPPMSKENVGKQETFRCRWGEVYLYVPGAPTPNLKAVVPDRHRKHLTVWHEITLRPGEQYTIPPNMLHWFQSGKDGAIVSEFSSTSHDETDVFTDPNIKRIPAIN
jgi:D-lyxose ketol-isomerase